MTWDWIITIILIVVGFFWFRHKVLTSKITQDSIDTTNNAVRNMDEPTPLGIDLLSRARYGNED